MIKFLLFISYITVSFAQPAHSFSTFHRVIFTNTSNEVLVVKIKNTDIWVTPGVYQDDNSSIHGLLTDLIQSYKVETTQPKLRGIFNLYHKDKNQMYIRNVYLCQVTNKSISLPDIVDDYQWLSVSSAIEKLSFPHIGILLKAVNDHPNQIITTNIERFKKNGIEHASVISDIIEL